MKRRLIVSLLASVGAFGVSANDVSTQIINGTPATVADYTNFASLYVETDTQYSTRSFCGATVINDYYVLTAAHCIVGNESLLPNVTVPVGLQDESTYIPGAYPRVVEYHFPSTYVDSEVALWPDDIAILKLDNPIGTGDLYSMLNFSRDRDYDGNDVFTAVGHGKQVHNEAPNANDPNLLEAPLLYVSTAVCTADQGSNITEKQICFNGANGPTYRNAICSGDSGGPIYVSRSGGPQSQVGIASFGYTVCVV
ncbi:S1 family peptidase [Vibrio sp. LaRot3]|uniref:S1 family peptidase n=1 Tax=Vibrio sp. LaRot3 TaxID=2998829 RepID=UPI0022CE2A5A|nr:trypsin-like serine protease [Vibrio sp. LaRot3]MDA0148920.1 trypsin-like serine protease [Vibrio sp. LaRot3]